MFICVLCIRLDAFYWGGRRLCVHTLVYIYAHIYLYMHIYKRMRLYWDVLCIHVHTHQYLNIYGIYANLLRQSARFPALSLFISPSHKPRLSDHGVTCRSTIRPASSHCCYANQIFTSSKLMSSSSFSRRKRRENDGTTVVSWFPLQYITTIYSRHVFPNHVVPLSLFLRITNIYLYVYTHP